MKTDRSTGIICDQIIAVNGVYAAKDYPEYFRKVRFKDQAGNRKDIGVSYQQHYIATAYDCCVVQKPLAS